MRVDEIDWKYQGDSVRVAHDVARTGCISAYVASPQFNFDFEWRCGRCSSA